MTLQGHHFQDMSKMMQSEQIVAFCSLIASVQRCYGIWRLQEVYGTETSFFFVLTEMIVLSLMLELRLYLISFVVLFSFS